MNDRWKCNLVTLAVIVLGLLAMHFVSQHILEQRDMRALKPYLR